MMQIITDKQYQTHAQCKIENPLAKLFGSIAKDNIIKKGNDEKTIEDIDKTTTRILEEIDKKMRDNATTPP
ncbi:MAG: hypothetical protein V1870_04735 [Candidatus Aenigmatarchaeota archaeon]